MLAMSRSRRAVGGSRNGGGVLPARGHDVAPERILLTASTSEAYAYLFKLLADPGDDVLVPRPSYPLFEFLANMESVEARQYPLRYHGGWGIDLHSLAEAISDRTRALVVVNPNNPTGSYVKTGSRGCARCAERGMALVSDEVFADYGVRYIGARHEPGWSGRLPGFSMSGLSKIAGLPQMKLGWIVAGGPPEAYDARLWSGWSGSPTLFFR